MGSPWSELDIGSYVVVTGVAVSDNPPPYRVFLFPESAHFACPGFYVQEGNGDLSDRAQVMIQEKALEILDIAKLAMLTETPVDIWVDTTRKRRISGTVAELCRLTYIRLRQKPAL